MTAIQRGRMLAAAIEAVDEVGYARMTVAQVIGRARISRKTFYDVFADREDCFLAAFEQTVDRARGPVREAYEGETRWRERIRAGLGTLLALMDEEPALAKLGIVEAMAAGERVLAARSTLFEELALVIDQGRSVTEARLDPPGLTAEGVVGAVFAVLHTRVMEGAGEPLSELLGPLMSIIVLPYLGARTARRELSRSACPPPRLQNGALSSVGADPLDGLQMRLTHRTVSALTVIGQRPGASNRSIAEGSGIVDQGQISKLLNRLARLELIENRGGGQEKGAPNAWHLTARGVSVERATRPR
ncbi:MAG: TetR/AcrR family transcriptional regulator [Solirubrobacteraceae bacterium]